MNYLDHNRCSKFKIDTHLKSYFVRRSPNVALKCTKGALIFCKFAQLNFSSDLIFEFDLAANLD